MVSRSRRAVVSAALLAASAALVGIASAASMADASSTSTITSAKWAVVPTQSTTSPPPTGALTLTASSTAPQYFRVVNAGTVSVTAMTYVVTVTSTSGSPNVKLTACTVAWAANACPGTSTVVATWSSKSNPPAGQVSSGTAISSTAVPAAPNASVYLQASPGGVPATGATITVNTSVSSGPTRQIRTAAATNA